MSTLRVTLPMNRSPLVMYDWSADDPAYHFVATTPAMEKHQDIYVFKARHRRVREDGYEEVYGEEISLAMKISTTSEGERELRNESSLYSQELWVLQGVAVPVCYGLFKGRKLLAHDGSPEETFWGLLLQYCGDSPRSLSREQYWCVISHYWRINAILNALLYFQPGSPSQRYENPQSWCSVPPKHLATCCLARRC